MKNKILIFIFFTSLLTQSFASNKLSVSGYVTDAYTGSPIGNHPVHIVFDSIFNALNNPDKIVFTNNFGFYTDTLIVPGNIQGIIGVSTLDFCDSSLITETQPIHADISSYYIDFHLCETSPECEAAFSFKVDSNTTQKYRFHFTDQSEGNPTSWLWDFGDGNTSKQQNPVHHFEKEGSYKVCLSISNDSAGCYDSVCRSVAMPDYYLLGGFAYAGLNPLNNPVHQGDTGIAFLYRHKSNNTIQLVDSNRFTNLGYFWFSGVLGGNYILRVVLSDHSTHSNDYLPTYYNGQFTWQSANLITVTDTHAFELDTYMVAVAGNLSGPGSVSGQVVYSDPSKVDKYRNMNDASVILTTLEGEVIGHSYANSAGYFIIEQIPLGSYRLQAEIPGKFSNIIQFTLTGNDPFLSSLILEVNDYNLHGIDESFGKAVAGNVYPNPAKETANIELYMQEKGEYSTLLFNQTGQVLFNRNYKLQAGLNTISINTKDLRAGMYFFRIVSGNGQMISRKLLIQ